VTYTAHLIGLLLVLCFTRRLVEGRKRCVQNFGGAISYKTWKTDKEIGG
jgi:hypothetical protein